MAIGTQSRPDIFDLAVRKPDVLYKRVVEVAERVTPEEFSESRRPDPEKTQQTLNTDPDVVKCDSGDVVRILQRPGKIF